MDFTESQLIKKIRDGEQDSFTLLYQLYSKRIYGLALRMCGNKEDSEDIVQKTFIQAFDNINNFKEESSIYTWLYTISKNICLRLLEEKRKSSFSNLEQLLHSVGSIESQDNFTVLEKQNYVNQVKEGCLLGLLRCLSFHQRISFILNVLLEVKVKDAAVVINKSETATRVLICRAKQNLKNFLCRNCSLYEEHNPCRCENLINFSIKQGWISNIEDKNSIPKPNITAAAIEKEISSIRKTVQIFRSLEEHQPSEASAHLFQEAIKKYSYKIFSAKKVK